MKLQIKLILSFLTLIIAMVVIGSTSIYLWQKELERTIGKSFVEQAFQTLDNIDRNIYNSVIIWEEYTKDLILQEHLAESNRKFTSVAYRQKYIDQKDREWRNTPPGKENRIFKELASNRLSEELIEKINEDDIVEGIVKNLTDYGAFIDLGGIDGLLHITDISWKKIKHPSQNFQLQIS